MFPVEIVEYRHSALYPFEPSGMGPGIYVLKQT